MIKRDHDLPVKRQAQLLDISRSMVYYRPRPVRADTLALMRRIDELHLELPFAGSRMLRDLLRLEGTRAGRHRIRRLMRIMGIEALYRRKNTSARHRQHPSTRRFTCEPTTRSLRSKPASPDTSTFTINADRTRPMDACRRIIDTTSCCHNWLRHKPMEHHL